LDRFKLIAQQIIEFEKEKLRAINDEDFDTAKKVKLRIDQLRNDAIMDNKLVDYVATSTEKKPPREDYSSHTSHSLKANSNITNVTITQPNFSSGPEELLTKSNLNNLHNNSNNNYNGNNQYMQVLSSNDSDHNSSHNHFQHEEERPISRTLNLQNSSERKRSD